MYMLKEYFVFTIEIVQNIEVISMDVNCKN